MTDPQAPRPALEALPHEISAAINGAFERIVAIFMADIDAHAPADRSDVAAGVAVITASLQRIAAALAAVPPVSEGPAVPECVVCDAKAWIIIVEGEPGHENRELFCSACKTPYVPCVTAQESHAKRAERVSVSTALSVDAFRAQLEGKIADFGWDTQSTQLHRQQRLTDWIVDRFREARSDD